MSDINHDVYECLPESMVPLLKRRIEWFVFFSVLGMMYVSVGVTILLIPKHIAFTIVYSLGNMLLFFSILYFKVKLLNNVNKIIAMMLFFLSITVIYVLGLMMVNAYFCLFFLGIQLLSYAKYSMILVYEKIYEV